jgi:hypothetical protein
MNDTNQTAPSTAPEKPVLLQPDNHNKKVRSAVR